MCVWFVCNYITFYVLAYESYVQMDKLIKYINGNKTLNATIIYSTLADYIDAVNSLNLTWSLDQPDFFTNVAHPHGMVCICVIQVDMIWATLA